MAGIFKRQWVAAVVMAIGLCNPALAATTIKIATLSPEGSTWMKLMREGATEVAERSKGEVSIKLYPGGVMGDDNTVLKKIRFGQLQGGALTGGVLASYYKDAQAYSLPFLFNGYGEIDAVRKTFDQKIADGLAQKGLILLGMGEGGMAHLMSKNPLLTLEDFKKTKLWIPANDDASRAGVGVLGISPVPLPLGDVLTGLQTRMIDTIAAPPAAAIALQWHSQTAHVLDLPVLFIWGGLVVDKKAFDKLAPEQQSVLRDVMAKKFATMSEINRKDEEGALAALKTQGLKFETPAGADLQAWHAFGADVTRKVVDDGFISEEAYLELKALLDAHRAAAGGQ